MQQPPSPQLPPWDPTNDALLLASASTALSFTSYADMARRVASDQSKAATALTESESQPAAPITYAVPEEEEQTGSATSRTMSSRSAPTLQASLSAPYSSDSSKLATAAAAAWYLSQSEPSLVMDAYSPLFFDDSFSFASRHRRSDGEIVLFASALELEHRKNARRRNTVHVDFPVTSGNVSITTDIKDDEPVLLIDGDGNRSDSESGEDVGDSSLDTLRLEDASEEREEVRIVEDDETASPRGRTRIRPLQIVSSSLPTSPNRPKVTKGLTAPLHLACLAHCSTSVSETPTNTPKAPRVCPHGQRCPYARLTPPPILAPAPSKTLKKSDSAAKRIAYATRRLRGPPQAEDLFLAARPPPPKLSARLANINSFDEAIHPFSTSPILGGAESKTMNEMETSEDRREASQMPEIQAPRPLPALGLRAGEDGWKSSTNANESDWIPVSNARRSPSTIYSSRAKHTLPSPQISEMVGVSTLQPTDVPKPKPTVPLQPPELLQLSSHPLIPNIDHLVTRKTGRYSRAGHRSRGSESSDVSVESIVLGSEKAKKRRGSLAGKYAVSSIPPFRNTRSVTPNAGVHGSESKSLEEKPASVVKSRPVEPAQPREQPKDKLEKRSSSNILEQLIGAASVPAPVPKRDRTREKSSDRKSKPQRSGPKAQTGHALPPRRSLFGHALGYALGTGPPVRDQTSAIDAVDLVTKDMEKPVVDVAPAVEQQVLKSTEKQTEPVTVLNGATSTISVLDMIQAQAPPSQMTETTPSPISVMNPSNPPAIHKSTHSTSSTSSAVPVESASTGEPILNEKGRLTREHMESLDNDELLRQRTMEIKQILAFQKSLEIKRETLIRKLLSAEPLSVHDGPEFARLGDLPLTGEQNRVVLEDEIDLAERTLEVVRWEIAQFGGIVGSHIDWKECRTSEALSVKKKEPWEYRSEYQGVPRPTHVVIKWDVGKEAPSVRDTRVKKPQLYEAVDPSSLVLPEPSASAPAANEEADRASSAKGHDPPILDETHGGAMARLFDKTPLAMETVKPKKPKKVDGKASKSSSRAARMAEFDFGPPPVHTSSLLSSIKGIRQDLLPKITPVPESSPKDAASSSVETFVIKRKAKGFGTDLDLLLGERPKQSKGKEPKSSQQLDSFALFGQREKAKNVQSIEEAVMDKKTDSEMAPAVFDLAPPIPVMVAPLPDPVQADVQRIHDIPAPSDIASTLKRPLSAIATVPTPPKEGLTEVPSPKSRQRRRVSMSTALPGEEASMQTMQHLAFDSSDDAGDADDSRDYVSAEEYLNDDRDGEYSQDNPGKEASSQLKELTPQRPILQRKRSTTLTDLPSTRQQGDTTGSTGDNFSTPDLLKKGETSEGPTGRDSEPRNIERSPSPTLARFPSIADPPLLHQGGTSSRYENQEDSQHPSFSSPYHIVTRSANTIDEVGNVINYATARVMSGGIKIGSVLPRGANGTIVEEDEDIPEAMDEFETGETLPPIVAPTTLLVQPTQAPLDPAMPLQVYSTSTAPGVVTSPASTSQPLPYPPTPVSFTGGLLPSTSVQLPPPKVSVAGQKGGPVEYCGDFRTTGHCRFGARCRYSHDIEPNVKKPGQAAVTRYRPILRSDPSTHPPNTEQPDMMPVCPPGYQLSNIFPRMHHIPGVPLAHQPPVPYTVASPMEIAHPRTAPAATLAAAQGRMMEDEDKANKILRSVGITPRMFDSQQPMAKVMADGEILYDMTSMRTRNPSSDRAKYAEQKKADQRITAEQLRAHISRTSHQSDEDSEQRPLPATTNVPDDEFIWKVSQDRQPGPSMQAAPPATIDPRSKPRPTRDIQRVERQTYSPMQPPPSYSPVSQLHYNQVQSYQSTPSPHGHYGAAQFPLPQQRQHTPVYSHSRSHSGSDARRASSASSSMHSTVAESPQVSVPQEYLQALIVAAQQGAASGSHQTQTPPVVPYPSGPPPYGIAGVQAHSMQPPRMPMQTPGYPAPANPAYTGHGHQNLHGQHPQPHNYTAQHYQQQQYPYAPYPQSRPF